MNRFEKSKHDSPGSFNAKLLSLPLETLSLEPPQIVGGSATIRQVLNLMREKNVPAVLICESDDGPIQGVFTERDALRVYNLGWNLDQRTIREIMRPDPFCHGPWDSIGFALKKMIDEDCPHLPVIDLDGRPVGLLNHRQLLRFLGERAAPASIYPQSEQAA